MQPAPTFPQSSPQLDAATAVGFLIARGGDVKLAAIDAARYTQTQLSPASEAQLLATIAADPSASSLLGPQVRMLAQLRMLEAFKILHIAFIKAIPNLHPADTAKAYTSLATAMASLSPTNSAPPTDQFEAVMKHLPPEIADAVESLVRSANTDEGPMLPEMATFDAEPDDITLLQTSRATTLNPSAATNTNPAPAAPFGGA